MIQGARGENPGRSVQAPSGEIMRRNRVPERHIVLPHRLARDTQAETRPVVLRGPLDQPLPLRLTGEGEPHHHGRMTGRILWKAPDTIAAPTRMPGSGAVSAVLAPGGRQRGLPARPFLAQLTDRKPPPGVVSPWQSPVAADSVHPAEDPGRESGRCLPSAPETSAGPDCSDWRERVSRRGCG